MRLDLYLSLKRSLSRSRAKALIEEGNVTISGKTVTKASYEVDENSENLDDIITVNENALPYVSRGGLKLKGALDFFGVAPVGRVCADIGASTGGFTDCLLKHGACKVYAVDSGSNQLAHSLRLDSRVISMEGFNARYLSPEALGEKCSLAVADLSFISQTLVLEGIASILSDEGEYIGLIKPQFECGRSAVGKGGIVKNAKDHLYAIERVTEFAVQCGLEVRNVIISPIKGGDGNREFLFHAVKVGDGARCLPTKAELSKLVK